MLVVVLSTEPATSTSRRRLGRLGIPSLLPSAPAPALPSPAPPLSLPPPPPPLSDWYPPAVAAGRRARPLPNASLMRVDSWAALTRAARQPCKIGPVGQKQRRRRQQQQQQQCEHSTDQHSSLLLQAAQSHTQSHQSTQPIHLFGLRGQPGHRALG